MKPLYQARSDPTLVQRNKLLEGVNRLLGEALSAGSEAQLRQSCVEVAEDLTGAAFGFMAEAGPGADCLRTVSFSARSERVFAAGEGGLAGQVAAFELDGLYGRVMREGESLISNDLADPAGRIGTLGGLPSVRSFLAVPLLREGRTVGMVGLANRDGGFWHDDMAAVEALAPSVLDAIEGKRSQMDVRAAGRGYRSLFETMRQGCCECEMVRDQAGHAVDCRLVQVNPAFERLVGVDAAVTRHGTMRSAIPGLDDPWIQAADRVVRRQSPESVEHEMAAFGRWYEVRFNPVGGDRFTAVFDDITPRRLAEAPPRPSEDRFRTVADTAPTLIWHNDDADGDLFLNQHFQAYTGLPAERMPGDERRSIIHPADAGAHIADHRAELQHRVRNILAVIRSVVSRSNDGERSTEEYVQHLQGRISALARTQAMLTRAPEARLDLQDMLREELLAQVASEHRFLVEGPDVELPPKVAEVLTLAVHELATNATKYGAFARENGRLAVRWRLEDRDGQDWVVLVWTESGVPVIDTAPRRSGFGAELILRRVPYELRGRAQFELRPGGLHSTIEFPLIARDSILRGGGMARS